MRVPKRWSRRPVRPPIVWWAAAGLELILGMFLAIGVNGLVPLRIIAVVLAATGVALGAWRASYDAQRYAAAQRRRQ